MAESLASLLKRIEPLPAGKRDTQVALYALSLTHAELVNVIEELSLGSAYEQRLAGVAACATCNIAWISSAIADPDPYVHRPALRIASAKPALVSDDVFRSALGDASATQRNVILRSIGTRTQLADSIIDSLRADWGDYTAGTLLATCSPEVVRRLLPDLLHAITQWRPLVRKHPSLLLHALKNDRETTAVEVQTWWDHFGDAFACLMQRATDKNSVATTILDLLERFPARIPLPIVRRLPILARVDANRVMRLLNARDERYGSPYINKSLGKLLARSGAPEFEMYIRQQDLGILPYVLTWLAPRDRPAMYEIAVQERPWRSVVAESIRGRILDVLPREYGTEVARKIVKALEQVEASQDDIRAAKKYLPPTEVSDELLQATRLPDAHDRESAWKSLILNAARPRDSAHLVTILEIMAYRLKNEQSPVRLAAWYALRGIPIKRWDSSMLPHLAEFVKHTLDARDVSTAELNNISSLALDILVYHRGSAEQREFAFNTIDRLGLRVTTWHTKLFKSLPKGREVDVFAALKPLLDYEMEKGDRSYSFLLILANAFRKRLDNLPEVTEALLEAARAPADDVARRAIELYLSTRSRTTRVVDVLDFEPSAIDLVVVEDILSSVRTDLLDFAAPVGRFAANIPCWYVTARSGHDVRRWTTQQQAAYLALLDQAAASEDIPPHHRARVIHRFKNVPGGHAFVRKWAEDEQVQLAEAGISALSSSPDDLPLLLSLAGTDRARVAMYAASGASRRVEPSALYGILRVLLTREGVKVTSRKEAVRLAAMYLPASQAISLIAPLAADKSTHRDVLSICVRFAATHLLGTQGGWDILSAAIANPEPAVRSPIVRLRPLDIPPSHRKRYADLICSLASSDDKAVAAMALANLPQWWPYDSRVAVILCSGVTDLKNPDRVWESALQGLVAMAEKDATPLRSALETLLSVLDAEIHASEEEDDGTRPVLHRIDSICHRYAATVKNGAVDSLIPLVAQRDETVKLAAELLLTMLNFEVAKPLDTLWRIVDLCHDRPRLATRLSSKLQQHHEVVYRDSPSALPAAAALAEDGGLAASLFATAIVSAVGKRKWTPAAKSLLARLRRSKWPDVRDAALDVHVWSEDENGGRSGRW